MGEESISTEQSQQFVKNAEYMAVQAKRKRYYTKNDVSKHFQSGDLWITMFNRVLDLSPLIQDNFTSALCKPLIDNAGKDISHFFNPKTQEPLTRIDASTGNKVFFTPYGRFLHVLPVQATSEAELMPKNGIPWWRDTKYRIGLLSEKERRVRVINMLTHQEHVVGCPCEETIEEI